MLDLSRAREIISFAKGIRDCWHTNDPFELASIFGFKIKYLDSCYPDFKAQVIGIDGYPIVISINNKYSTKAKTVLCAHELGHALLHTDNVCNHFAQSVSSTHSITEHEANLFAVALLIDNSLINKLIVPLEMMDGYSLKKILDYNISKS